MLISLLQLINMSNSSSRCCCWLLLLGVVVAAAAAAAAGGGGGREEEVSLGVIITNTEIKFHILLFTLY
jgi:hypothetical protein